MVKVSYGQKPYRRSMMQTWGAEVFASPSMETNTGRAALAADPDNQGSLGLAISEAVEDAASRADTNYALGSVLNHVLLHQTVIGLEAKRQFEKVGDYPDMIFAPCGGGSNFGGAAFPFFADQGCRQERAPGAVEPDSCPTLTRGHYAYDFGDTAKLTPMMLMYTLGHDFMPPGIHAGGFALPWRFRVGVAALPREADRGGGGAATRHLPGRRYLSPAPRASSPRRNPTTPLRHASTRHCAARKAARPRRCSSTFPGTVTSTWGLMTAISAASWKTSPIRGGDQGRAGTVAEGGLIPA